MQPFLVSPEKVPSCPHIQLSLTAVFVAVRIYAVWSRNLYMAIALFILGMVNPATIVTVSAPPVLGCLILMCTALGIPQAMSFALFKLQPAPWPLWGCITELSDTPGSSMWYLTCVPMLFHIASR